MNTKDSKNQTQRPLPESRKAGSSNFFLEPNDRQLHQIRRTILRKLTTRLTLENLCCSS